MVNRVPVKPRVKSIRADLSDEGWRSVDPHEVGSLDANHALSLWALVLACCATAVAAFVLFGCHDSHGAVAVLLSAAGMIALLLKLGAATGKPG